ncbi:YitT family protein [Enterococcus diestrammenae]|uniref:YitT family protein n=1 Tax=Enterococcus diestrammenae TaxID=1155073 RepID=UPI0022E80EBD|nr:YitT family protein [Enterococcus diestrammenae]
MLKTIKPRALVMVILGSTILSFGLFNIHSFSGVTEGGGLGLTLLLDHWFHLSPAITGFIFNMLCYAAGWKILGREFIFYSIVASVGFSASYSLFEAIGPFWPHIGDTPLLAAVVGAIFVGVGCGLCVRAGGAPGGDDAMAMSIAKVFKMKIQWAYLASDLVVLVLSLSYIPLSRIGFSLLTVILSGQLIGIVQEFHLPAWMHQEKTAKVE